MSGPSLPALPKDTYTPWITRVAAAVIDIIPLAVLMVAKVSMSIAEKYLVDEGAHDISCKSTWPVIGTLGALGCLLGLVVYAVWNWGYRQGRTGSSVGKSMLKFKVVSEHTWQPVGFGRSEMRFRCGTPSGRHWPTRSRARCVCVPTIPGRGRLQTDWLLALLRVGALLPTDPAAIGRE